MPKNGLWVITAQVKTLWITLARISMLQPNELAMCNYCLLWKHFNAIMNKLVCFSLSITSALV